MARALFIRLDPKRLLLKVDVVADSDGLLVLNVGRRHRQMRTVGGIPPSPAGVVVGVSGGRRRELAGGGGGRPVVVVVRRRKGHRHGWRWRRVVVPVLRVVLRRVGVRVLGRVRRGGREHVAVGRSLLRLGRRRRLVVVAVAVAGAPTAVTSGGASTVATRVTHPLAQIDADSSERASELDLEAWAHRNCKLPLLLLRKLAQISQKEIGGKKAREELFRLRGSQAQRGSGMELDPRASLDRCTNLGMVRAIRSELRGRKGGDDKGSAHASCFSACILGVIMEGCAESTTTVLRCFSGG